MKILVVIFEENISKKYKISKKIQEKISGKQVERKQIKTQKKKKKKEKVPHEKKKHVIIYIQ